MPSDEITIKRARIRQAAALVFRIASGEPLEKALIDVKDDDDFADLERLLNAFADEFCEAKRERDAAEEARLALIEEQKQTIARLSAPILDVWERVVVMPIMGPVDAERAEEMMQRALEETHARGARSMIIDVTGATMMDTGMAEHLGRMIRALGLLGVRCVVTGIRGAVAQSLVSHGQAFEAPTRQSLREGLRECLRAAEHQR